MPSPSVTFRLSTRERERLQHLCDDLALSTTDVVRLALSHLHRSPDVVAQAKAFSLASAFLDRLRAQYGRYAQLEFRPSQLLAPTVTIDGEPISKAKVEMREEGDQVHLDLIDPTSGIAIRNAHVFKRDVHKFVALEALWVSSPIGLSEERDTRRLADGRIAVRLDDTDDATRERWAALDDEGRSSILDAAPVPAWTSSTEEGS